MRVNLSGGNRLMVQQCRMAAKAGGYGVPYCTRPALGLAIGVMHLIKCIHPPGKMAMPAASH
jgi:CBS-domain-containing membrane protein